MIVEPSMPERRPSPGLSLNLSSNNPFRNRAASPAIPSPALNTASSAEGRPMSRNPFLSTFEAEFNKEAANAKLIDMSATLKQSPKKATFGPSAEELFNNLRLDDSREKDRRAPPRAPQQRGDTLPSHGHRPSRSEEEERRLRGAQRGSSRPRGPPGSGSRPAQRASPDRREPERRDVRRPRRNSESSMIDRGSLDPEEERRRRERRKMRDERDKDAKNSKDAKSKSSGRVRKPQGLDIIDKLDVSGIYGPSMIHHDGPYDAVQPHRNRKKDHRAPMEAFPLGSANNILGGSGPLNKNIDLDTFHGRGAEGFSDFGATAASDITKRPQPDGRSLSFNPKAADVVHGEESHGLGTSTFLEGAPASRTAIQRRESENQQVDGGLGRKKSIAQRFRGISQPRRGYGEENGRITSPHARYGAGSPGSLVQVQSAGGYSKADESNPFFDDYDTAYDRKGATIKVAESGNRNGPVMSPSSPEGRNALTRTMTADSMDGPADNKQPSGFLGRMKSLKGGRRPRPERPAA